MPAVITQAIFFRRRHRLVYQRRKPPAQFVYDIVEMTDCILEAINSNMQAYISALTGRQCPSISQTSYRR